MVDANREDCLSYLSVHITIRVHRVFLVIPWGMVALSCSFLVKF